MTRTVTTRYLLAATLVVGLALAATPSSAFASPHERDAARIERVERRIDSENWLVRLIRFVQRLVPSGGTLKDGAVIIGGGKP